MEYIYIVIFLAISFLICLAGVAYFSFLVEQKIKWLDKFEDGKIVVSSKYGEGIVLCIKPLTYSAYVEFENFTGWISLNDLIPINSRYKGTYKYR